MATLLLVGGERSYSDDVALLLQMEGFTIVGTPGSGDEAVEYAQHFQPDAVLLISTQNLDDTDGMPTIRALRQAAPTARMIIYTARNHPRYVQQALNVGVNAFVIKTIPFGALKEILAASLHGEQVGLVG